MIPYLLILDFVFVFALGAAVGSFVNVCVARLPYEKSLIWPGSRCSSCFQPVKLYDNIPLISYWVLRGRCRTCGSSFSMRYFWVELFTALLFTALFYLTIYYPPLQLPFFQDGFIQTKLAFGLVPWQGWVVFAHHAALATFLLVASLCDLNDMEIPLSINITGTVVGLVAATFLAWPFPSSPNDTRVRASLEVPKSPLRTLPFSNGGTLPARPQDKPEGAAESEVVPLGPLDPARTRRGEAPLPLFMGPNLPRVPGGLYRYPFWHPAQLPSWMVGSWQMGLLTGLAGALAGMLLLRGVGFLFGLGRGKEGLGLGDADLMMMAGSFVGWQVVVIAFFVSVGPALLFALLQMIVWTIRHGKLAQSDQPLPFGPSLSLGVLLTLLGRQWIAKDLERLFFDRTLLLVLVVGGGALLLLTSFLLRIMRPQEVPSDS